MKIIFSLISLLYLFSFSALKPSTSTTIKYQPDTVSVLRNPAMGWVMYEEGWSFNGGKGNLNNPISFWKDMDKVNASAYSNILYIRVLWNVMEPEEGKFAWIHNKEYKAYIQKAKDRGLKLAFRVFFDNGVPDFVYKAGAKSTLDPPMSLKGDKQPYYDDPIFLDKLSHFIKAFAKEYDNPATVDFVDAYGLGRWGEGHGVVLKNEKNRQAVIERVTKDYADNFKKILTVMTLSSSDYSFTKPLVFDKLGFLPRRDGIGSFWFDDTERGMLKNLFPQKAFIGEGCYWFTKDTTNYDHFKRDKRFKMNNFKDAFTVAVKDALDNHSNTSDLRVPKQCRFWIEEMPDQVQLFISKGGYRLYPSEIKVTQTGKNLIINHDWQNYGVGVLPNKHPNWNYKYKVGFALLDSKTNEVKYTYIDKNTDPSDWLKGKAYSYTSSIDIPKNIKSGRYKLCVAIIDEKNKNSPGIKIAVSANKKIKDWVNVLSLDI